MKAPLPPDESARLAAVRDYAVLDTPPEADFDSIATLAAQICDMPIALITLIDGERQWFKAKVGIEIESTPREVAFCAHAINRPRELLVVNDATKDPRFADNPYVTEANGIRFYAGAPLVTPGGHALGTLCVVDRKPREISAGQREALAVLSRHVMTQLQLRRQLRERQRIERALAVSEERWQFALEGSDQGVWDWDVPSQTVYFSPRWCAQLGHAPDEVPHRLEEWSSRVHPDDLPATLRRIQEHFEGRTPIYEAEFRMRAKDGTWRWIADRGKVMTRDAAGKPLRVVGTHIDITERRGLEEKLRRSEASLSRAQQVAHIGSWETDLVTMEVAWSEETHRIFGTSPATFQPNHESFLDRVHPEDRAKVHEAFLASLPADEARVMEHRICLPDGSVKHVEERWRVFREQPDRPARAVGTCQDITGRRQLEEDRKKLIRDLGERLKEVRALHQVSALLGKGGALTPAVLARIAGLLPPAMQYPEAAAARIVLGDLVQETPDYPPGAADRLEAAIDGGPGLAGRIEVAYRGKVPAAEKGPFLAEEHRLVESLAEMLSTHARRHAAEQALAETLECNRDLIRSIEGIVWEADAVTLAFTFVSEQAQRLLGYPTRAWLEEPEFWEEHIHPDDRAATVRSCRDLARQGRDHVLEYRMLAADGREVWLRDMVTYVAEPGRRPLLRGVMMDITERKLAEGEISALAHRLTAVLESITDAFYTLDRGWCFAYLNGEAERFLQRPKETLIGRTIWEEFPAAVGSTFEREYRRAMQERVTVVFEEFYPAPLNRWFEVRAYPSDEGLAVYFQDITERRRSAEALRLSEERFRELAENVADIFYNYDPVNHRLLYANPAYETIFGRSLEGAYAEPLDYLQGVHPDDRAGVEAALAKQLRGENTEAIFRVLRPDGSVRWVTEQAVPVLDAAGRVERLVGTMRDITERQEVINRLSVSEERFRLLSKATQDAIWDWDLVTGSFWWSEGFETLFGYSLVEIAPTIDSWSERVHPEDREAVNADVNRAIAQGDERWSGEYRFLRKDGSYAFIMDRGYIIRDAAGKAVRMIGGMTDVTELKRTESELRRKDALLRMAGRLTRTGGWSIELPGQQVFWSDEIFDILEYPPGQQPPLDEGLALYLEPWRQQVVAAVETCIRDGTPFDLEVRIRTAKGRTLWVRVGGEADRDATGVIRRVQGAMRDITERKQDEEAVRKSAGSLAAAQAIAHLGSWELDLTTGRSIWSAELFRLLHRDPAAGAGSFADFIQLVHPDDRPICEQANARLPEDRAPYEFEYRTNPALGAIRHLKAVTHVIRDEQDRAVSATGTVQDITERKQAEQELLRANQSLEGIVKALQQIGTAKSNLQDLLELIAAQTQTLAGASGATIEFIEGDEMVYRAGAGSALNHVGLRLARSRSLSGLAVQEGATLLCEDTETDARVDRAACRKVGVRSMVVAPLRDGEQIIGVLKILSDRPHAFGQRDMANLQILVESLGSIIQRRRLTEQMAASEEKYRLLFANNPQPMWVFDAGTLRFLAVNNAAVQHYGYSEAEFLAMTVLDIRAEDDRTTREQALAKMIHAGRDTALRRHVKKDGAVIEVEATSDSVVLDGRPARLVVARDVT
ncbi:MAG TPA: PAS domain-containing protein, partial [Opitutaceae bacterium]|nr:PAS domain-containing protein [Opitutaceae bacterium]